MVPEIVGGVLIGGSAGALMLARGRVAGVGGMVGGLVATPGERDGEHRVAFLLGLVLAGLVAALIHPSALGPARIPLAAVAIGGLLVGWGGQRGGGCTSGHSVCGVARFSKRSVVATLTFMATGALTVLATHALWVPR
ncbi:MAG TPA: YeeE/YedE thiosulfate transporter family protein [Polyangiaceae bacterium]|jgi:hypothetical protein